MTLATRLAERIRREGPIPFAAFMEAALSDEPDGFFTRGGGAGRAGGDFITSPEVGPLFGALVARALDATWRGLGEPDPFVVVEAGAGRGRLATGVLRAAPRCAPALRYVLVERSPALRAEQRELLTLEPFDEALGPFSAEHAPEEPPEPVRRIGPIVAAIDDLPAAAIDGVILANELLDNLPVRLVERAGTGWLEIRVGLDGDRFVEVPVAAALDLAAEADLVAGGAAMPAGARLPVPVGARTWLERAGAVLRRGELVVLDYADTAASLAARGQESWLRTYRAHGRGLRPLDDPGSQDITCDLPVEYVVTLARRVGFELVDDRPQAEWLGALGIDELVAEGRATWDARAHLGDLRAVEGRSRVGEAAALTDPGGLGAHRVLRLGRR